MLIDKIEVDADVDYIDVNKNEDTRLKVGTHYYINAGVGYSASKFKCVSITREKTWFQVLWTPLPKELFITF